DAGVGLAAGGEEGDGDAASAAFLDEVGGEADASTGDEDLLQMKQWVLLHRFFSVANDKPLRVLPQEDAEAADVQSVHRSDLLFQPEAGSGAGDGCLIC